MDGAGWAGTAWPQRAQNAAPGRSGLPQFGQFMVSPPYAEMLLQGHCSNSILRFGEWVYRGILTYVTGVISNWPARHGALGAHP